MFRRLTFAVLVLALVLPLPSCAGNKAPTPIAGFADNVSKLEDTGRALLQAAVAGNKKLIPATGKPLVSNDQLAVVALAGDKLGRLGTDIAKALTGLSEAKAAGKDLSADQKAVSDLLDSATGALRDIGKAVPPGLLQTIDTGVATAFGLIAQLKLAAGL